MCLLIQLKGVSSQEISAIFIFDFFHIVINTFTKKLNWNASLEYKYMTKKLKIRVYIKLIILFIKIGIFASKNYKNSV